MPILSSAPMATAALHEHQDRLLKGFARAVIDKGYAATTIADIVGEAAVSRRTFYEYFPAGKAECFIALYEQLSLHGLDVLRQAIDPAQPWERQVDVVMANYLAWMASDPRLIRTLFIEILSLGAEGLAVRRRVQHEIVKVVLEITGQAVDDPDRRAMAMAVVGAIHELVLERLELEDASGVEQLTPLASSLVRRLLV